MATVITTTTPADHRPVPHLEHLVPQGINVGGLDENHILTSSLSVLTHLKSLSVMMRIYYYRTNVLGLMLFFFDPKSVVLLMFDIDSDDTRAR